MSATHFQARLDRDIAARSGSGWTRALRMVLVRLIRGLDRAAERRRVEQARADAEHLRGLAGRMRCISPGMAADLSAAADRHERQLGL
ncbi:MAG: hypothetical protein KGL18_11350 [Burkholderiales bacterium]|nr:hypothetical protein [Burkholderiales bacterium]MDE1927266.1 hypothetical protein [Burkholderiales bacterium]MDE2157698.1 hypothetical protein [Burkholderiales bacterium]MDE2503551.1 hypothetical protein [Burkholderiales bacterium]